MRNLQGGRRNNNEKKEFIQITKKVKVVCTSCGAEFESGSVLDEVRVDTCSNCHHSILENKDLLVLMDVLKNSTKNTDLNKKMSTWYFIFVLEEKMKYHVPSKWF